MEIWKARAGAWDKKHFADLPTPESAAGDGTPNLYNIVLGHMNRPAPDNHHWIVFSEKEEHVLTARVAGILPKRSRAAELLLEGCIVKPLSQIRTDPPLATYVAEEGPNAVLSKGPMRLALEFNRPHH